MLPAGKMKKNESCPNVIQVMQLLYMLQNPGANRGQEEPLQERSFKAQLFRLFSWITGMDQFEHLHIRQ